jgi:raffinose/stachyose/melibiose transport system substrate-binding protein
MKKLSVLLVFVILLSSLTACQPAATTNVEPTKPAAVEEPPAATETPKSDEVAKPEVVTLKVMDQFTEETDSAGMDTLVQMFTAKNPNIQIQRDPVTSDNMRTMVQTSLTSDAGADIIYYDTGPGFAGVLAKSGLLLPLDDYYMQFNWDGRIFPWTKARTTFDGKVYGIGNELEFLGAYYNKKLFADLGLTEPKTFDDLLSICQKGKEAGVIPIAFGDGPKWPAYHMFSMVTNNLIGRDGLDNIFHGDGRWDSPEVQKGIQMFFADMNQAGCFIPDSTAVSYEDSYGTFYSGQALILLTGTWLISDISANVTDFEVGWFFFPSIEGKPIYPPAGLGSGYFVSAKTAHPLEAAKFLDFLFSEEAAKVWMENMSRVPPIKVDTSSFNLSPLLKFAVGALQSQEMGYNIDVLTPDTFNTMMGDGFQAVMLGEKTAEQQAQDLQKAWEEAIAAGKITK